MRNPVDRTSRRWVLPIRRRPSIPPTHYHDVVIDIMSKDTFGVDHSCQSSFCLLANGSKLYTPKFAKTPGYASSALPCSLPMLIHQTPPVHSTADLRRVILSARARKLLTSRLRHTHSPLSTYPGGTKASIHVVQRVRT